MDSKIKGLTILAMLGIMVLVAAIIVVFNYERFCIDWQYSQAGGRRQKLKGAGRDGMVKALDLSAFLQDETFFDHEKIHMRKQMEDGNTDQRVIQM